MMTIIWILSALIALIIVTFAVDRDGFWTRTAGDPDLGQTNFSELQKAPKPNEGLVCPPDYCPNRKPNQVSPVYDLSATDLRDLLISKLADKPRALRVDDDSDNSQLRYVTRTPIMRYPDTMSIDFISLDDNRSTIAIHAKAQVGQSDLGNNLKRINLWLGMISDHEVR